MRIALAPFNPLIGDIPGNAARLCALAERARDELKADAVVFPELALCGFPAGDLLLRDELHEQINAAIEGIRRITGITLILGLPQQTPAGLFNAAQVWRDGAALACYHKRRLQNTGAFDESRYFVAGDRAAGFELNGLHIELALGEEGEHPALFQGAKSAFESGLVLNLAATPFAVDEAQRREAALARSAARGNTSLLYLNAAGGQDEWVFDGQCLLFAGDGELRLRSAAWQENLVSIDLEAGGTRAKGVITPVPPPEACIYAALLCGLREYVHKNSFKGVVIGLSGGIDSALALALAVDALGAEQVEAVMMPSRYTAEMSQQDARQQAEVLGAGYQVISIEPLFKAFLDGLAPNLAGTPPDTTEENLQARCRGALLMALANKKRRLVLCPSNKSELAVGYTTLYGDMAGGYSPLKDVPKTWVYRLANYRNSLSPAIPQRVIERPPSAELAADQQDSDSLPPYALLDDILERYLERRQTATAIVAAGHETATVQCVLRLLQIAEHKRQQSAPGTQISRRGFSRARRLPITSGFQPLHYIPELEF